MNTKRFQDMVALVTGGSSGIGRATALAFAAEGAKVIIAARRENLGAEVVETIKDKGGEAAFVKTDVAAPSDIENLFKVISERYGRLDCAFNNAGRGACPQRLIDISTEEWNAVMSTIVSRVPLQRLGRPEEIAGAVLWLCSKASSFVTGKEIVIGGGQGIRA